MRRTSARQSRPSSRSIEAFATAAASGLPMKVGPCARTGTSPVEIASGHPGRAQRGGHRQVAAGHAPCRRTSRRARRRRARRRTAPRCGRSRWRSRRRPAARRGASAISRSATRYVGRVEAHAAGALHHRLDDHGRELGRVLGDQGVAGARRRRGRRARRSRPGAGRRRPARAARRPTGGACRPRGRRPTSAGGCRRSSRPARCSRRRLLGPAEGAPVLQAHLDRDLDRRPSPSRPGRRGASGSGVISTRRRGEPHRRLVGEPAEHDVAHPPELVADGGVEHRVGVAVDGRPPRRHPVHQLAGALGRLGQAQAHARRRLDHQRRHRRRHRARRGARRARRSSASTSRAPMARSGQSPERAPGTTGMPRSSARRTSSAAGRPAVVR